MAQGAELCALDRVELVPKGLPAGELVAVRGAIALTDGPQRVRAVTDRLRRFRAETVDPRVADGSDVVTGPGRVHSHRSIRAAHGHTMR